MRKWGRIVIGVLIAAILILMAVSGLDRPSDPLYEGKPLSYWLRGYNDFTLSNTNSPSEPTGYQAYTAVWELGTNALPLLLNMLGSHGSVVEDKFFEFAWQHNFMKHSGYVRSSAKPMIAMYGLGVLGRKASNAVPQLMKIYERNPNAVARQIVPVILARLGPSAEPAIPMLIRATTNADDNVRLNAVVALAAVQPKPELTVPILIRCLNDSNPDVQANAAMLLGALGKNARPAIPALVKLLEEEQAKPVDTSGTRPALYSNVGFSKSIFLPGTRSRAEIIKPVIEALKAIDPDATDKAGAE